MLKKIKKNVKQNSQIKKNQLNYWKVKYHQLIMCKPSYDLFIDDKNLGFRQDWYKDIQKTLLL